MVEGVFVAISGPSNLSFFYRPLVDITLTSSDVECQGHTDNISGGMSVLHSAAALTLVLLITTKFLVDP